MTSRSALALAAWGAVLALGVAACGPSQVAVPGKPAGFTKSSPAVRASRRLYDGAPPTIPHAPVGASCTECHNERGLEVPGLGYAPPSPHERTRGLSAVSRCQQCHVFATTEEAFRRNAFVGLPQDLGAGRRLYAGAPPVLPHPVFMRENCAACHTGPAAREEIRTSHPERQRCQQCHVGQSATQVFRSGGVSGS